MAKQETVVVVLDVTVSRSEWEFVRGSDPVAELPEFLAECARGTHQLLALPRAPEVVVVGADLTSETADWVTVRIVLEVRLDGQAWLARWGVPAEVSVGPHVAAFLAMMPILDDQVDGTVVCVKSNRVLGETSYRRRG